MSRKGHLAGPYSHKPACNVGNWNGAAVLTLENFKALRTEEQCTKCQKLVPGLIPEPGSPSHIWRSGQRYRIQVSQDGRTWTDHGSQFTNKEEVRVFFAGLEGHSLDWRVGFLLRTRAGVMYRVVDRHGREMLS